MNGAAAAIVAGQSEGGRRVPWTIAMHAAARPSASSTTAMEEIRSFEELVERYSDGLLRLFHQRLGRAAEAEDLLQETFLRAYQAWHRVDRTRPAGGWIYTIGYRVMVSHGRKRWLRALFGGAPAPDVADRGAGPDAAAEAADERGHLWQLARHCLNTEQFTAVWLHYGDDLPAAQIATVLGKSENAVRILLFRARERLRNRLEPVTRSDV
jgi:RNA polymerase sigma-70 factor (ECF subfamily)